MTTPDRIALQGHYVTPGSPAEAMLRRADAYLVVHKAAAKASDDDNAGREEWNEVRRCLREALDLPGYLGRAIDDGLVASARLCGEGGQCNVATREALVSAGLEAGLTEDVARRSVVEGLLRGANPRKPRAAAPPPSSPIPPKPPAPPAPKSRWEIPLQPRCA
jgi:hypothetical protein